MRTAGSYVEVNGLRVHYGACGEYEVLDRPGVSKDRVFHPGEELPPVSLYKVGGF
jgi:hypothetical protein